MRHPFSLRPPGHVLITGAGSGLGAALATTLAGPGRRLVLVGRRPDPLHTVAAQVRARGAEAVVAPADVTEAEAMAAVVAAAEAVRPLDLVIANAGVSAGTVGGEPESAAQVRAVFATNLAGVLNTVLPVLPAMSARGGGQVAVMASLAGFRGQPGAPAYSASKAAVRAWGEALRPLLRSRGMAVTVIMPGFVATPLTAVNAFPMPQVWSAERAARHIVRGLARNKARIAFPWPLTLAAWLGALLPPAWVDPLLARLPHKPPGP